MAVDYSFKGQAPMSSIIDAMAQKRVREQQIRSSQINDSLATVNTASSVIQQMVQSSVDRQHKDAVNALAGLYGRQSESTPAPGAILGPQPQQTQTLPGGLEGPTPQASGMLNQPAPVPFGQTPQYNTQLEQGLFKAFPAEAAKQNLEQLYSEKKLTNDANNWQPAKWINVDKVPRQIQASKDGSMLRDAQTHENVNARVLEPYTPPSDYGQKRMEMAGQQDLVSMTKDFTTAITNSPSAKSVIAADNFSNQVERVKSGEVIPDKSIMGGLITDAERAFAATGVPSEKRMQEIMPKTFNGTLADFETFVTNNPTSRDAMKFLSNLQIEVDASAKQKRANVNQVAGGILARARLIQKTDPEGYNRTVRSWGIDPSAAKLGKIKFLPGANSIFYGQGYSEAGSPTAAPGGLQVDQNALDAELKKRKLIP